MTKFAIKRPVLTFVVFAVIVILGGISLTRLPVDMYPDISLPTITVITPYIGASAQDVERNLTEPLEEALSSVPDVKEVRSLSQESMSAVYLEFQWGKDLDAATSEIRDALERTTSSLPKGVDDPILWKFDAAMMPVLQVAVSTKDERINIPRLVQDQFATALKRAEGVGNIMTWFGTGEREVTVTIDRSKLERSGLSLNGIARSLAASNINFPVGDVKRGRLNLTIRVPSEFADINEIELVPVGLQGGRVVRLGDIAAVAESVVQEPVSIRLDDEDVVLFAVQKRSGANTVQVARNIHQVLDELRGTYPNVALDVIWDSSETITTSINNLLMTLLVALVLVVIVSFLLLGNFSGAWITSTTIPVSLIAAFIYLYFAKGTINIISLSGLAITIGMVVDNGIVVLENVFRQRERGRDPKTAAAFGVSEVAQAVLAATLTTVAIFLPLLLVEGYVGIFFKELVISVPIILFASLFTAMTLTPMLASRFLKTSRKKTRQGKTPVLQWIPKGLEAIGKWYKGALDWSLSHRWVIIVAAIALFGGGMALFQIIPTSFMEEEDPGFVDARLELPVGTRFEVTDSVTVYIVEEIREIPDIATELDGIFYRAGSSGSGFGALGGEVETQATAEINLILADDHKLSSEEIAYRLNRHFADLPGIKRLYFYKPTGHGPATGRDFTLEIYGHDITLTDSIARVFADSLERIPGFVGVKVSRESARPELWLEIDRERAYSYGLTPAQIGAYLHDASQGKLATQINQESGKLDVVLRFADATDWTELDLESVMIPTPMGFAVPLANLARFDIHEGPLNIERKEGERLIKVEADLHGLAIGDAKKQVGGMIAKTTFPYGTRAQITGQAEEQGESFQTLFLAMIAGILLVFLVMAAQFESFKEPFIIMFAIPFAITGVAIAFFLSGSTFGIMGYVGMILLVGVVVNNAIVLVDYINLLRRRGKSVREAILDAGERRLRPVLMTTLTTVFGLSPLAFIPTEGSEMWAPLGVAVIGGLLFSTLVTLIFVPVLYSAFERGAEKRRLRRETRMARKQGGLA
jgi:HAE1 family hydrophobic/amphiphilic exporter-1